MFPIPFLWSLSHTHSPKGPEVLTTLGKGSQHHKPSMKSLWEQGQWRGVALYCPFPQQPKCGPCVGTPTPPKKSPSLGTTQHHVWGSRASTSAKRRCRDWPVQLDGDSHSCLHHTSALGVQDTQDQQNPNSCPDRSGQPHSHSLFPSSNNREGSGLPQLRVLLGVTEQLQPANEIQVSAVYPSL